jgi:diphosphomevalonate decarboxylase
MRATAIANANIAFIKYWGNRDATLRIPWNDSISMNLSQATTTTTVEFGPSLGDDVVVIGDEEMSGEQRERVVVHLDRVRALAGIGTKARVMSSNSFPMGTGIAASASAFAALTLAATSAASLNLDETALSRLARLGSGSACRSIPGGFVEWQAGDSHETSFARSIAPPEHWDLRDIVAIVSGAPKAVSSGSGHAAATTSPFFAARQAALHERLATVKRSLLGRDFATFGRAIEEEAIELHVIAMTSRPPIYYLAPDAWRVLFAVRSWRAEGLGVYFTLDAGPNVHLICLSGDEAEVARRARAAEGVRELLVNRPAGGARLSEDALQCKSTHGVSS